MSFNKPLAVCVAIPDQYSLWELRTDAWDSPVPSGRGLLFPPQVFI